MAEVGLYLDAKGRKAVTQDDYILPDVADPYSAPEGQARQLWVRNDQDYDMDGMVVKLGGVGSRHVQLAVDQGGQPGVWAAPGQSIRLSADRVKPGQAIPFWSRGIFKPEDAPADIDFDIIIETVGVR
jgi:hypothetical protein